MSRLKTAKETVYTNTFIILQENYTQTGLMNQMPNHMKKPLPINHFTLKPGQGITYKFWIQYNTLPLKFYLQNTAEYCEHKMI